jgi:hypothetical protein
MIKNYQIIMLAYEFCGCQERGRRRRTSPFLETINFKTRYKSTIILVKLEALNVNC